MLVSTGNDLIRVQCAFVDTPEIERITEFIASQRGYVGAYELPEYTPEGGGEGAAGNKTNDLSQLDSMFEEVARRAEPAGIDFVYPAPLLDRV